MTQDTTRDFLSGSGEAGDKKQFALFMEVWNRTSAEAECACMLGCTPFRLISASICLPQATKLAKVREDLAAAEAYIGQTGDALEVRHVCDANVICLCCSSFASC